MQAQRKQHILHFASLCCSYFDRDSLAKQSEMNNRSIQCEAPSGGCFDGQPITKRPIDGRKPLGLQLNTWSRKDAALGCPRSRSVRGTSHAEKCPYPGDGTLYSTSSSLTCNHPRPHRTLSSGLSHGSLARWLVSNIVRRQSVVSVSVG